MQLFEHAGFERAHDPHAWWIYDARETSPKTCPLCLSLHGSHYRGDEIEFAFPYHLHMRVNAIKTRTHMPRDPNCKCVLRWGGRTNIVLERPYGVGKRQVPEIPKKIHGRPVEDLMTKDLRKMRKRIVKHARETWRRRIRYG